MTLGATRRDVRFTGPWRDTLNASQREAVTHGDGPLLIIAGAGTGKTTTLACRVAHLIESGVPEQRILLLTFSRRAAAELLSRAQTLIDRGGLRKVWGGTFHAIANRMLRMYGRGIGIGPDFTVLDQADTADLLNLIRGSMNVRFQHERFARKETLATIYSRMVNASEPLSKILEKHFPWCSSDKPAIAEIFTAYTRRKRLDTVLDYDDLLLYWNALMASAAAERVTEQFDHILVDEYQDTNALQAQILLQFHARIPNITVVGDDAQAIYSFRSATIDNILSFAQRFTGARIVALEENYRSTAPLLAASNAVIAMSPQRHDKTLVSTRVGGQKPELITCGDEAEQAAAVCESILAHRERGVPLMHQVVLFRASHHSDLLEVELGRRNIPFVKYGGLKFLEAAHVKDVVAILRILENPRDSVSWFRVLQLLDGIGPAQARRLMGAIGVDPPAAGVSPLRRLLSDDIDVPASATDSLAELRSMLTDCADQPDEVMPLTSQIERIRLFCEPTFARRYSNPEVRLRDLEQIESLAASTPSRAAFLTDLALDPPTSTSDLAGPPLLDEDFLILSTIHSAKGGEWDVVCIIHASDGHIPSDMATGDVATIEEERRLLYVALTRARDALEIYFPLRYYRRPRGQGDTHGYAQLTRFIPNGLLQHFDMRSTPAGREDDAVVAPAGADTTSVDAFLERLLMS